MKGILNDATQLIQAFYFRSPTPFYHTLVNESLSVVTWGLIITSLSSL